MVAMHEPTLCRIDIDYIVTKKGRHSSDIRNELASREETAFLRIQLHESGRSIPYSLRRLS